MEELKSIEFIESRARKLLNSGQLDPNEAYHLVESLFIELSSALHSKYSKEAAKRGLWNIELLDNAVEEIVDAYGGNYKILELWELAWELRLGQGNANDLLTKLLEVIDIIKRRYKYGGAIRGRRRMKR